MCRERTSKRPNQKLRPERRVLTLKEGVGSTFLAKRFWTVLTFNVVVVYSPRALARYLLTIHCPVSGSQSFEC